MTITREQLELAARAAGIELDWYTVRTGGEPDAFDEWVCDIKGTRCMWNPLTDHGQLHDLAMACRIRIDPINDIIDYYVDGAVEDQYYQELVDCQDFPALAEAVIMAAIEQQQAKEKKE